MKGTDRESDKKQVVVIGGGTGTHTVLSGLQQYQDDCDVTAIVTMADSGGSTGRLRDEFGYLPVGDVRMALAALAREEDQATSLLRQLFTHRFSQEKSDLHGHNVGNLLLVALTDILGSEAAAIEAAAHVLRVRGRVLPVTLAPGRLRAEYSDGSVVVDEHSIEHAPFGRDGVIQNLSLLESVPVNPRAVAAIMSADCVVLGPGDLYTSVLANCIVPEVATALRTTSARLVYVSNLMTKRGQTENMSAVAHASEVSRYIGRTVDHVLANTGVIAPDLLAQYAAEEEYPVVCDGHHTMSVVGADLLAREEVVTSGGDTVRRSLVRHAPERLAALLHEHITQSPALESSA